MRRGIIKYLGITFFIITILALGYIRMNSAFSPFKTEEQKQVKELYLKSVMNTNDFTLIRVNPIINESLLFFDFKLTREEYSLNFIESNLSSMNLVVEQIIDYLNQVDNLNNLYNDIVPRFYMGKGYNPDYISFVISRGDNGYYFKGLSSVHCNDLCDFYMMTNVTSIQLDGSNELAYNDKKVEKLSNLKNLKEIYYVADIDGDYLYLLKKKLQIILPECKLYEGDHEIVIEEE